MERARARAKSHARAVNRRDDTVCYKVSRVEVRVALHKFKRWHRTGCEAGDCCRVRKMGNVEVCEMERPTTKSQKKRNLKSGERRFTNERAACMFG